VGGRVVGRGALGHFSEWPLSGGLSVDDKPAAPLP